MSAVARRFAAAPRVPWRLGALVALLALAALIAALVAGSLSDRRPAPFGPAANGQIAFIDPQGRVVTGDPATGASTILVAEAGHIGTPLFSPDGSRIAYAQQAGEGLLNMFAAAADGSGPTKLTPQPIAHPTYVGWSPSGEDFLIVNDQGRMLLYDVNGGSAPLDLSERLEQTPVQIGLGYNFRSTHAFRPPDGKQVLFVAGARGDELSISGLDGTGFRRLFEPGSSDVDYLSIGGAEWSPDGSQIVMLLETTPDNLQPFLLNADGSGFRSLKPDLFDDPLENINSPLWSPDGSRIAFQHWSREPGIEAQQFHPIAIVDVATGELRHAGPAVLNGYISWQWSPDGKHILSVPMNGSDTILIVDVETGTWSTAPWRVDQPIDWQRVAP